MSKLEIKEEATVVKRYFIDGNEYTLTKTLDHVHILETEERTILVSRSTGKVLCELVGERLPNIVQYLGGR